MVDFIGQSMEYKIHKGKHGIYIGRPLKSVSVRLRGLEGQETTIIYCYRLLIEGEGDFIMILS